MECQNSKSESIIIILISSNSEVSTSTLTFKKFDTIRDKKHEPMLLGGIALGKLWTQGGNPEIPTKSKPIVTLHMQCNNNILQSYYQFLFTNMILVLGDQVDTSLLRNGLKSFSSVSIQSIYFPVIRNLYMIAMTDSEGSDQTARKIKVYNLI